MTTQLAFMGRVGEVSGFDAENDATVVLILETLLAAYARIAVQETTDGRNIVLRPAELTKKEVKGGKSIDVKFGRHFVFLQSVGGYQHSLYRIEFKSHDNKEVQEGRRTRDSAEKSSSLYYIRTSIKSVFFPDTLKRVDPMTIIDEEGRAYGNSAFDISDNLYYIDIPTERWKKDAFYVYAIRTAKPASLTTQQETSWSYLSFFARSASITSASVALDTYISHLIADNLSPSPISQKFFNPDTKKMEIVEGVEKRMPQNIGAEIIVFDTLPGIPENTSLEDWPIVPSVMFMNREPYVIAPWSFLYTKRLFDYIRAIKVSLEFGRDNQISNVKSLRQHPDYELALGIATGDKKKEELIIITTMIIPRSRQHKTTIAIKDSSIARLIFGSNPEWQKQRVCCKSIRDDEEDEKRYTSAPGFGCLDYTTCSSAIRGSIWENLMSTAGRNGEYHEMLGRSADELDSILFADSSFYRSFIGKNVCYADAVAHWINRMTPEPDESKKEQRVSDIIERMRRDVKEAYREALAPYVEGPIAHLVSSANLGTMGQIGEKDSSNYIRVLQEGRLFMGMKLSKQERPLPNTTKLMYEIDMSKYLAYYPIDGTSKRIDGGIYLYCGKKEIIPHRAAIDIRRKDSGTITSEELEMAYEKIAYSAYCPYGYFAHSLYKILDFVGNHVDFFPATKLSGMVGGEVTVVNPRNCAASLVTPGTILGATPVDYFNIPNEKGRELKLSNLRFLRELWERYIFTWSYIRSMVIMEQEIDTPQRKLPTESIKRINTTYNSEKKFAFVLAKFLREKYMEKNGGEVPNIYELLPYGRFDRSEIELERIGGDVGFLASIETAYKNVFVNFCECDFVHRFERLWCMRQCEEIMKSNILESEFTNLDYVHGFLLAENFSMESAQHVKGHPGYLGWKQYLAMSASVYYAKHQINEKMTFMEGTFDAARSGMPISAPKNLKINEKSAFRPKDTINGGDVMEFFNDMNRTSAVVFANISNVPIYNYDKSFGSNILVSTLNESLSTGSCFVYVLARSLHLKNDKSGYEFDFVNGKPVPERQAITNSGANQEFRKADERPSLYVWEGNGPAVMAETKATWAQDLVPHGGLQHMSRNIVDRVRGVLDPIVVVNKEGKKVSNYYPKADRCKMLILEASHGRGMLSRFPPRSRHTSFKSTLRETIISHQVQISAVIPVGRTSRIEIRKQDYSSADVDAYLKKIGVMQ